MTVTAINKLAAALRTIEDQACRTTAVRAILPVLAEHANGRFNTVQFCLNTDVPIPAFVIGGHR